MPRHALLTFALVLGAAVAGLLALALVSDRSLAFTLGVRADSAVVKLEPRDEVCQRPIVVPDNFERVQIQLGTYGRPGAPYSLEMRPAESGRPLAGAMVSGGYADSAVQTVPLSREVPAGREVALCIRNTSRQPLGVFGSSDVSNRASTAYVNGQAATVDLMAVFEFSDSKSEFELLPVIIRRASLFHGGWASPAAYWLLLGLLVGVLATLPALALRSALRASQRD
jgi:hypothetical protein